MSIMVNRGIVLKGYLMFYKSFDYTQYNTHTEAQAHKVNIVVVDITLEQPSHLKNNDYALHKSDHHIRVQRMYLQYYIINIFQNNERIHVLMCVCVQQKKKLRRNIFNIFFCCCCCCYGENKFISSEFFFASGMCFQYKIQRKE